MSNDEILRFIIKNDIINLNDVQNRIEAMKREELLRKHPYKIWQGKDGKWRTYLLEGDKRKLLKRVDRKDLEDIVLEAIKKEQQFDDITFKNRFSVWVERQKDCGVSDNTISKYESDYIRFFQGCAYENMNINVITDDTIIPEIIKRIKDKKLLFRAVKSMYGMLNGVFEKSMKDKLISDNPCKYIDILTMKKYCDTPKKKTAQERTVSDEQMTKLYEVFEKDHREKPNYITTYAVELATLTGMRAGELSGLAWKNIDFKNKCITITQSEKYNRKKKEFYISSTKNGKERVIPMSEEIVNLLKQIRKIETNYGYVCEYVFANENGRIHARTISDCARNKSFQAGIDLKSIHALRRTLNSKMRCEGVSSIIASSILGHTEEVNNSNYTYDVSSFEYKTSIISNINKQTVSNNKKVIC